MFKAYRKAEMSFVLGDEIGKDGKNSKAYRAYDNQLSADIVIKQVEKGALNSPDEFFEEASCQYAAKHPNVVDIHYACSDDDHIYIGMPLYKNGSLKSLMNNRYLSVREIVSYGCQVLSGLHNIHSNGLIHFDVKPDNILIADNGEAMLADFGLAKQMIFGEATQHRFYSKMCPPETITGKVHTVQFDVYQLGLTLYRMCNGDGCFYDQFESFLVNEGDHWTFPETKREEFKVSVEQGLFPNRDIFPAHIPPRLKKVIKKCLEVELDERYDSALAVANALAVVDGKTLDWHFSQNDGIRMWEKRDGEKLLVLNVAKNNDTTLRKQIGNGKLNKVNAGCGKALTEHKIHKLLGGN